MADELIEAMIDQRSSERIVVGGAANLARYGDSFDSAVRPLLEVRCLSRKTELFVYTETAARIESDDENHTVAGNPIRFTRGPLEIRADAEWQALMPARQRAVVTGLTWPLLWRYGFLGERRGRTRLPSPSP